MLFPVLAIISLKAFVVNVALALIVFLYQVEKVLKKSVNLTSESLSKK